MTEMTHRNVVDIRVTGKDGKAIPVLDDDGTPTGEYEGVRFISPASSEAGAWTALNAEVAAVGMALAPLWAGAAPSDDPSRVMGG